MAKIRFGWRRWLPPVLAVLLVSVPLAGLLLWLGSHGLLTTFPQIVGQNCGQAYAGNDPLEAQDCFWRAYQRCQAATLVFVFPALDEGTTTHAITVQRMAGRCVLTDTVQGHSGGVVFGTETFKTYTCSGLAQQTRGLLLVGCGPEGNLYLPPRPVDQVGIVCGEVDNIGTIVYAGYGGVDGFGSESVARAEGCFWHAYATCTQPYTLIYSSGSTYTFVVQRQHGACGLSVSTGSAGTGQGVAPVTYLCAALTRVAKGSSKGGLVAHDCGAAGTITVPPATPSST